MKLYKSPLIVLLISVWLLTVSTNGNAYGQNGHRVVGQIAEWHLTPTTKRAVLGLLSGDLLPEVTTWADEMRSSPDKAWRKRGKWHYISLETMADFKPDAYDGEVKDIYTAIRKSIDVLRNPNAPSQQKEFYLRFLTHLIGDLHMPLHVGRAKDKGGNAIKVKFFGSDMNLHSLWDTHLIENQNLSFTEFATFINTEEKQKVSAMLSTQIRDWVGESFELRHDVYDIKDGDFSYNYVYQHMPTAKQQLLKAGVRLAGVLNAIFDPEAKPGTNSVKLPVSIEP